MDIKEGIVLLNEKISIIDYFLKFTDSGSEVIELSRKKDQYQQFKDWLIELEDYREKIKFNDIGEMIEKEIDKRLVGQWKFIRDSEKDVDHIVCDKCGYETRYGDEERCEGCGRIMKPVSFVK